MKIGRADVSEKVALIAEIGNNHEGSLMVAREMIEAAWAAGADAVKLQNFKLNPEHLSVSRHVKVDRGKMSAPFLGVPARIMDSS